MTFHLHHLTGCAPTPLAHYLKAVGVLRIVGEQKDKDARGWWQDEHFCLLTTLDRADIERCFLEEYAPTPFVSPWNRGSGFYGKTDPALNSIESSVAPRFGSFRSGIAAARAPLAAITAADAKVRSLKDRTKARSGMSSAEKESAEALKDDPSFRTELAAAERRFKELKADLFTPFLLSWRGGHRAWMDAAVVALDHGKVAWPSLLGTGGSDGRFDFTNNVMQRLGELFSLTSPDGHALQGATELLQESLWATTSHELTTGAAIGQFFPGGIGGANSTTGADGDSLINAWDFVLMMEGTVLFSTRSTRRLDPTAASRASAPFAVRAHAAGYGTRGREKAERGEQWMPLWSQPTTVAALGAMLGEARVQLGRQVAHRAIDVARAVARLGVARGIDSFTRFGYLERNGQSNIAVPLGRIEVRARVRSHLVDDLAAWLNDLQRLARDKHAPASLTVAEGRVADAVFAALVHDDSADRWQAVLIAAVAVEEIQARGTAFKAGPIPALAPEWVAAADDGSVEFRLARALGSAAGSYDRAGRAFDPVRHNWLPLQRGARRFQEKERRLVRDSRVIIGGRDPVADLSALVERRLIGATQRGQRHLPLVAAFGCGAHPVDLAQLLDGSVDLARVSALARAFMAVRWNRWQSTRSEATPRGVWPDEAWMALRLACLPWQLDDNRKIPVDEAIVRRLIAGDGATAVEVALRRLRAAGLRPPLQGACADPATARLWAAALAFPISLTCAWAMASDFEPAK